MVAAGLVTYRPDFIASGARNSTNEIYGSYSNKTVHVINLHQTVRDPNDESCLRVTGQATT